MYTIFRQGALSKDWGRPLPDDKVHPTRGSAMIPSRRFLPASLTAALTALTLLIFAACGSSEPAGFEELAQASQAQIDGEFELAGLQGEVEVIRDQWGIAHIYAQNMDDLFFAQGFVQAQDRLWQIEMWRRAAEGRLSEILGPSALQHDRLARLVKYRGPWNDEEFSTYHPEGRRIFEAFAAGVNAYMESGDPLPVEFMLTGVEPEPWGPETPLPRLATAMPLGEARAELRFAMEVAQIGAQEANMRAQPEPAIPLRVPEGVDYSIITQDVLDALGGFDGGMPDVPLLPEYQTMDGAVAALNLGLQTSQIGSNNWTLAPSMTSTGGAIVTNDPHRGVTNPSLRYLVRLNAPEWNVIGATEPGIPGVAIGHNGQVAWGLTIVGVDQADVYIEEVNPENPNQVRWQGEWEDLRIEVDTILVKDAAPEIVELKFSRHGPVFYEDRENNVAYAVRATMHEPGSAGYLAALRLNQVSDCRAFLDELVHYYAPDENMICGDTEGNIAWRASALTPDRGERWFGRLPVPGNGEYEWQGFRTDLPQEYNPERGWISTSNHNIQPEGYYPPIFFWNLGNPSTRNERLVDVFSDSSGFSVEDLERLLHDAYFPRAEDDKSLLQGWEASDEDLEWARQQIAGWDGWYQKESVAAALHNFWREALADEGLWPAQPGEVSQDQLTEALRTAMAEAEAELGPDRSQWRWGRIFTSEFPHPLVGAYNLPSVERSGDAGTVGDAGATFRHIIDMANVDNSVASSTPGQSARPGSPFYDNLLPLWGNQEFFPLSFSREMVEANAAHTLRLRP